MATINDLCDELLEQIFGGLSHLECLTCKRVCQRWLKLLMTSSKFHKTRNLHLKNCFIESNRPPMSVILNAKYPYDMVTILDNNNREMFYNKFKDLKEFWQHLGLTLVELCLEEIDYSCFELLTEMSNLKILKYRNLSSLITNIKILIQRGKTFSQIRVLHLGNIDLGMLGENIEIIRQVMPGLTELTAELIFFNEQGALEQYSSFFMALNLFMADIRGINEDLKKDILDHTGPDIKVLNFHATGDFNLLKTIVGIHPKISELHLACRLIPEASFTMITKLILTVNQFTPLDEVGKLVNLRSLKLDCKYQGCSFGHESVQLSSLETLVVKWKECKCQDCFLSLTKSFPNLKKFEFNHHQGDIDPWIIQFFLKNWKFLEKFKIASMPCTFTLADALPYTESPRLHLRHFHIGSALQLTDYSFCKLLCICPELHTLSFVFDGVDVTLHDILQIILPQFKNLNFLHIYSNPNSTLTSFVERNDCIKAIQHITAHGKSLRALTLPTVQDINEDSILDLFEHLDQLNQFDCLSIGNVQGKRLTRQVSMNRMAYNEFLLDLSLPGVYFSK